MSISLQAQDDYEFANTLAERRWFDLAEEQFVKIQNDRSLTPIERASGEYGMSRVKRLKAETESNPQIKMKAYALAILSIMRRQILSLVRTEIIIPSEQERDLFD